MDSLEEISVLEVIVQWNQPTFVSLLASLFGSPVDVTSENFLSLFEGALYFGMETILLDCKTWLTKAISINGVYLVQVNDLIGIWEFGSKLVNNYLPELCTRYLAKNFIWAMSCSTFGDVPHDLLLSSIKHSQLTVDSEKHLCDALLAWIAANKERCTEDVCIDLLKQIRISLLPLWFAAGKSTYQSISMCYNGSFHGAITMLKQPSTCCMDVLGDGDLLNLRIRLTEFTQRVDLSGCPQVKPVILILSMLPFSLSLEPHLRKKVKQLVINHERLSGNASKISWEMWPNLTFEAVNEIDVSNCPMLHLEVAVECFSKSFPSLRTLKAANHLSFSSTKVSQLVKKCPLLCDIDVTVDISPVIPTRMSILSSFPATRSSSASFDSTGSHLPVSLSYMCTPLPTNITKLTLEGRIDVSDFDLQSISDICASLTYINLKGCTSLSDVGISALICKCLKLNSIVACDTFFGQQSILALCSSNTCYDHVAAKHSGQKNSQGCNLQMLHMGGCKGINITSFSKLMSQAYMLKSLCLRETQVVDDGLYNFFGSSLEVLDVCNTKVSAAAVAHVIGRNPGLKCLKARGCDNLLQQESQTEGGEFSSKCFYFELGKSCKLDELSVGWGFSYSSLEALKPAVSMLKAIEVGLGGMLGHHGLKWLPAICPLLESVVLYFQVISDHLILNLLESLRHLKSFALCHCLGETSSLGFKVSMPNLRKLRLERVAPWMNNADLVCLSQNCANLIDLSLLGCRLLNSGIPFNAATYDSFQIMIESIGQFGPGLKPPSMYELRVPILNKEVKEVQNQIVENKKEWAEKGCSILSDGWRDSVVQKDIINFMVNSPKGSVFVKSQDVSDVSKDADLLFRVLDKMVEEVGEENVVQVVTDNASAYVKAGKLLEAKRPHLYWTPCAAHCLDLMLEDIGKQIPKVKNALKKAIFSNGYIYSHVGLVNLMRKFTNQRNLHRPAITRFATSFITLAQIHKQRNNLRKMVTSQEWEQSKWSDDAMGKKMKSYFLQDTFWRNVVYSLKLTAPLVKVLRLVDGEIPAMGYIYEAMDRAKEAIRDSFPNKEDEYKKAFEIIDHRWECQLHKPLHAAGHYLNPGFFYDAGELAEEVEDGLFSCIMKLVPDQNTQDKISNELVKYQKGEGLFGMSMAVRHRKTKAPESQNIISSGWPGLISIHLEECGNLTSSGVASLFDCNALEDILLRHNGSGIPKDFIGNAVTKLPMLRKISLDICDAKDRDFDIPELEDRHFLSHVKIARCKSQRCSLELQHVGGSVHMETLILVWDSKQLTITTVKERI